MESQQQVALGHKGQFWHLPLRPGQEKEVRHLLWTCQHGGCVLPGRVGGKGGHGEQAPRAR